MCSNKAKPIQPKETNKYKPKIANRYSELYELEDEKAAMVEISSKIKLENKDNKVIKERLKM